MEKIIDAMDDETFQKTVENLRGKVKKEVLDTMDRKTYKEMMKLEQELHEMIDSFEKEKFYFRDCFPRFSDFLSLIDALGESEKELVNRIKRREEFTFTEKEKSRKPLSQKEYDFVFSKAEFSQILDLYQFTKKGEESLISAITFRQDLKNALEFPTEKTIKSADNYLSWFKVCCSLKFMFCGYDGNGGEQRLIPVYEEGKNFFKTFSSLSKKYDERECESFWKKCEPRYGSIQQIFSVIDKLLPILVKNRKK